MSSRPDTPREPPLHLPDLREVARLGPIQPGLRVPRDQARRWRNGQGIPAEEYLSLLPTLSRNDDVVIDLIHNEFLLRQELGESPELAEFTACASHNTGVSLATSSPIDRSRRMIRSAARLAPTGPRQAMGTILRSCQMESPHGSAGTRSSQRSTRAASASFISAAMRSFNATWPSRSPIANG